MPSFTSSLIERIRLQRQAITTDGWSSPYQYLDLIFDYLHRPVDSKISKPWPRLSPSRMSYCLWISSDLLTMCPIRTWGTDRNQRCTSIMRKIETWKIVLDLSFYVNYFILSLIRQRNILPSVQIIDWKRTVPRVLAHGVMRRVSAQLVLLFLLPLHPTAKIATPTNPEDPLFCRQWLAELVRTENRLSFPPPHYFTRLYDGR